MKTIIKKCFSCGKEVITTEKRIKSGRGKYCSHECQFISMQRQIKLNCAICRKKFWRNKSRCGKRAYCSKKCRLEGYKRFDSERVVKWRADRAGIDKMILGKKGKNISTDGYYVYGRVKIHRWIMEQHIGRKLLPTEIVHHINDNKLDNRIENLKIVSRSEHNRIHKFLCSQGSKVYVVDRQTSGDERKKDGKTP